MQNNDIIPVNSRHFLLVTSHEHGMRLDLFLVSQFPSYSRSFFQKLISQEHIQVNNRGVKPGLVLKTHDKIEVYFPSEAPRTYNPIQHDLGVKIIYEHEHFLVISKPAGLNVHAPHQGSSEPTLVDWLLVTYEQISTVGHNDRPGIVHRLDKDTSGIMLVARTSYAHAYLAQQFKQRTIQKTYVCIVQGHPSVEGTINFSIMRHPRDRKKMTHINPSDMRIQPNNRGEMVVEGVGRVRHALSEYRVMEYFSETSLLEVKPHTGRTHQIRVHCAGIGHPIVADQVYGKKSSFLTRQALHAQSLVFNFDNTRYEFSVELPQDFRELITALQNQ